MIALLYASIKQQSIKMQRYLLLFFRGLTVLVWDRHAFSRFKMAAFQAYNKKYEIKNVAMGTYTITVITWFCGIIAYFLSVGLFTSFRYLNTMVWLENTPCHQWRIERFFSQLHSHHHLLILSMSKVLSFWVLEV